jgi:hypothetical protein
MLAVKSSQNRSSRLHGGFNRAIKVAVKRLVQEKASTVPGIVESLHNPQTGLDLKLSLICSGA